MVVKDKPEALFDALQWGIVTILTRVRDNRAVACQFVPNFEEYSLNALVTDFLCANMA